MGTFGLLFVYLRFFALMVAPAVVALYGIARTVSFKKRNGAVVHKTRHWDWLSLILATLGLFLFGAFALATESWGDFFFWVAVYFVTHAAYIEKALESWSQGIYAKGVVFPQYSCSWDSIEGIFLIPKALRFVHCEKGAFDYQLSEIDRSRLLPRIEQLAGLRAKVHPIDGHATA